MCDGAWFMVHGVCVMVHVYVMVHGVCDGACVCDGTRCERFGSVLANV